MRIVLLVLCILSLGCQRADEYCNDITYDVMFGSEDVQQDALDRLQADTICMEGVRTVATRKEITTLSINLKRKASRFRD